MPLFFLVVSSLHLLQEQIRLVHGQELPRYTEPPSFDYSISHRQSVCDRQQRFHNGTVELRHALEGLDLHVWMPISSVGISDLEAVTGAIPDNELYPGLTVDLLDEVAERGKFRWRNSFGVSYVDNIAELGKNFDDVLYWAMDTYDILGVAFTRTFDRISQGAVFPEGYIDASVIMVSKKVDQPKISVWGFLEPFTWQVWLMILVTFLVSGMIYQWMEILDDQSDRQKLGDKPTETVYFAALTFVGDNHFEPKTDYARMFVATLIYFSLMIASAYTANLASFLVVRNTPTLQIETIQDAVQANFNICVISGTPGDSHITRTYPKANLVRIDVGQAGEVELYRAVLRDDCTVAVSAIDSWDRFKGNSEANPDCQLEWVGRVIRFLQGGFVTRSDSGTLCTSLVRDVFNLHMLEMEEKGIIKALQDKYRLASADQQCDVATQESVFDSSEKTKQLDLQDMGGLFIVFYVVAVSTALAALFWSVRRRRASRKKESNIKDTAFSRIEEAAPPVSNESMTSDEQQQPRDSSQPPAEDVLLAQLETLQSGLKEVMRHAAELKHYKKEA